MSPNSIHRHRRFWIHLSTAVFTLLLATESEANLTVKTANHAPGQLIVKLRDAKPVGSTGPSDTLQSMVVSSLLRKLGGNSILSVRRFQTDSSLDVIQLANKSDEQMLAAMEVLKQDSRVEYSEPNYELRTLDDGVPNDPSFSKQWGMLNTGQADPGGVQGSAGSDINIVPLWKEGYTGTKKIIVAVIDTGIDWSHPDIQANLYTNPGEIAGNGVDDDHNGFVDDIHGWNFYDNNNNSRDDHNHGTHCAGTIGAVGNNGSGITGINWNVSLMPIKFLDSNGGGYLDRAVEAVNYAHMMKANVLSNSWGGGSFSQTMFNAIKSAREAGILFVAAAGNDARNNDDDDSYPANYDLDNVISVAATDNRDGLALFSNYGRDTVHVAAPGVRIWSTIKDRSYASFSGTSMAAPQASGVAALLMSANPGMTYLEVKDRMIKYSDPVPSLKNKVVSGGRLDAYNAMHGLISGRQTPNH